MSTQNQLSFRTAYALAIRDLRSRFARSILGPLWLFFTPLLLLGVYWFVFGVALKVQWQTTSGEPVSYVVPFFSGLIFYLYFAEILGGALNLFVCKRNYIQRTSVSLSTIWMSFWMRSTLQFLPTFVILWIIAISLGHFSWIGLVGSIATAFVFSLLMLAMSLPLVVIGPFFGDLSQTVSPLNRALFYSAPLTFPLSFIPERFQAFLYANPLTLPVIEFRKSVVFGGWPDPINLVLILLVAVGLAGIGWGLFVRLKRVIPDVI